MNETQWTETLWCWHEARLSVAERACGSEMLLAEYTIVCSRFQSSWQKSRWCHTQGSPNSLPV